MFVHRVVVQVSGDQISAARASELVDVVNSNANTLSLPVKNVVAGNSRVSFCCGGGGGRGRSLQSYDKYCHLQGSEDIKPHPHSQGPKPFKI